MTYLIREGETGNQDFTLYDENGAFNGAGSTIAMIVKDRAGASINMTGKVAWLVAASGTARVNLAITDLVADRGPYTASFIVTVGGLTYSFPKEQPDVWKVWN
jgi:hypothetical protein